MAIHVGEYIQEELSERDWSLEELALKMGGDYGKNLLCIKLIIAVQDKNLRLDNETVNELSRVFEVSPEVFTNLEAAWLKAEEGGE